MTVRGLAAGGLFRLCFLLRCGGADGFRDRIGAGGPVLVGEQQGLPRGFLVPGEVVGEHADQHVRFDAVGEVVVDRTDLQLEAFQ